MIHARNTHLAGSNVNISASGACLVGETLEMLWDSPCPESSYCLRFPWLRERQRFLWFSEAAKENGPLFDFYKCIIMVEENGCHALPRDVN